jgi:YVTN family beta-propeller protein
MPYISYPFFGNQTAVSSPQWQTMGQPGVAVDSYPIGVGVNPVTKKIYVTNEFSNTVSVIDETTDKVSDTIQLGSFPYGVAINPFNDRVYVTNRGSNTVTVIDSPTDAKLSNIPVGNSPVGIAVNPSSNWIYVTNIDAGTVSVIDGITNKVTNTINVGRAPYGIAVNPLSNKIYVTNIQSSTVSVIDGRVNKVTKNIIVNPTLRRVEGAGDPVLNMPILTQFPLIASLVAVNSLSNMVYVTNTGSDTVSVIDGNKDAVIVRIAFNVNPTGVGNIECNGQQILSNSSIVINNDARITCTANSSHGYKFGSWSGLVGSSIDNPIHFMASNYGILTANFQQSLSLEQYLAIILGPVSVVSIVVSWLFRNRQRRYLNKYVTRINNVHDTFLYENHGDHDAKRQEFLYRLDGVRKEITQLYIKGRISDAHYNVLDKIISDYAMRVNN